MSKTTVAERQQLIAEYQAGVRSAELARRYHLSRERVRQLIVKSGLPMPTEAHRCQWCGEEITGKQRLCPDCADFRRNHPDKKNQCVMCGKPISSTATYCVEHRPNRPRIDLYAKHIDSVCERYLKGEHGTAIAKELGVSNRTVYLWLEERGIVRRGRGPKVCWAT